MARVTLGLPLCVLMAALAGTATPATAQDFCPSRKIDVQDEIIPPVTRPRPPLYASFLDSAYVTCFRRITEDPGSGQSPVPAGAIVQAWNADQTLVLLASGEILRSPSWALETQLQPAPLAGKPRWSPSDPNALLYIEGNRLRSLDVRTGVVRTLRTFDEYTHLDTDRGYHDLSQDEFLALLGWVGDQASEAFVYDVAHDRKGTVRAGTGPDGSVVEDLLMTPGGAFALLQWTSIDGRSWLEACDTAMVDRGRVAPIGGPYDVTVDEDSTEWVVGFTSAAVEGIRGEYVAKYRIPDGWDRFSSGDPTGADTLCVWEDRVGGGNLSGRALGTGFVIASASGDPNESEPVRRPFTDEVVKIYLDSGPGAPRLERLADTRSNEYVAASPSCAFRPALGQAARPNATVSRDGTRVLWGSTWGRECRAEAYVQDIANKRRNSVLWGLPANTWVKLQPKSFRFDGSRETNDMFPMMQYGRAVFAPEYGSIISWGGGGHGASRQGNDVWMYDTARNEWHQVTPGDPVSDYPNPGLPVPLLGDYCHNDSSYAEYWSYCEPTGQGAIGSTRSGAPWSSEIYSQRAWDSLNRRFVMFGPNYIFGEMSEPLAWFAARASYYFDPHLRAWRFIANDPHLYHQGGAMAFDPVNNRMVAMNHDWWHHPGYNSSQGQFNQRWWLDVTTYTWTEKPSGQAPNMFDSDLAYDPAHRRMLRPGGDFPVDNQLWSYDPSLDTWIQLAPEPDPTWGYPPEAAPSAAVSSRDQVMIVWGFGGDGTCLSTWAYDTNLNYWRKMNAAGDPIGDAPQNDRTHAWASLVYDPTNNVFFLLKPNPAGAANDIGGWSNSLIGEIWAYKYAAETSISGAPASGAHGPPAHLAQNAPNPFNPVTWIAFSLSRPTRVKLTVLDVQGRTVAKLVARRVEAGETRIAWDGTNDRGQAAASGVYWYELRTESGFRTARKMVLLR